MIVRIESVSGCFESVKHRIAEQRITISIGMLLTRQCNWYHNNYTQQRLLSKYQVNLYLVNLLHLQNN